MWRFIGVLCFLLLPCAIDADDSIRDCPENKVCVNFVEDWCRIGNGGDQVKNYCHAILWDVDYVTRCYYHNLGSVHALLDIEVIDSETWSFDVAIWSYTTDPDLKFIFGGSELKFSGKQDSTYAARSAILTWGSGSEVSSASFDMKELPKLNGNIWQYSFTVSGTGKKLIELFGGSVTFRSPKVTIDATLRSEWDEIIKSKATTEAATTDAATVSPGTAAPGTTETSADAPTTESAAPAAASVGVIVGGVVGGLFLLVFVAVGAFFCWRRHIRNRERADLTFGSSSSKTPTVSSFSSSKRWTTNSKKDSKAQIFPITTDIERLKTEMLSSKQPNTDNHGSIHVIALPAPPKSPFGPGAPRKRAPTGPAVHIEPEPLYENLTPEAAKPPAAAESK